MTIFREKIKTLFMLKTFSQKSCRLCDSVEKYFTAGQTTDYTTERAHCMLDTRVYRHTLRVRNTYCCSTATMVARTNLSVILHVLLILWYSKAYFFLCLIKLHDMKAYGSGGIVPRIFNLDTSWKCVNNFTPQSRCT